MVIGFNIQFDLVFINITLRREFGVDLAPIPLLDVLSMCRALKPNARNYSLEMMAAQYRIPVQGRHTALGDALMTARLFFNLLPELEERGVRTLCDLGQFLRYQALY